MLAAAGAALWACASPPPIPTRSQDSIAIVQDSTAAANEPNYQAQLVKYRHDSSIIDSMTQVARQDSLLQRDSLFNLYRSALEPEGISEARLNALSCVESALGIRYGLAAADRVIKELRDTVYRDRNIADAEAYMVSRAPSHGRFDSANCASETHRRPESIDGTRLDDEPRPPRRSNR